MGVQIVEGNVLDAPDYYIVHQVNNCGIMGGGLALQVRNRFPGLFEDYQAFCLRWSFEEKKKRGFIHLFETEKKDHVIVGVFGQNGLGRNKNYTDYEALEAGLISVATLCNACEKTAALPFGIGCGLAGGDWKTVYPIIKRTFIESNATIYRLPSPRVGESDRWTRKIQG